MTTPTPDPLPFRMAILVVDEWIRDRLLAELREICPERVEIVECREIGEVLALNRRAQSGEFHLPMILFDEDHPGVEGREFIEQIDSATSEKAPGIIRLSRKAPMESFDRVMETEAPSRTLSNPWLREALADCLRDLFLHYLLNHAPSALDRFSDFVGLGGPVSPEKVDPVETQDVWASIPIDRDLTDRKAFELLVGEIDSEMGSPPRQEFPPGSMLFAERDPVETVFILESGQVRLTRRTGDREILFHSHSAGRILGLLALAQHRRAFFTCRAVTQVRVIPIPIARLDQALHKNSKLAAYFSTVLIRSLAARNRRVAELQLEVEDLNARLRGERDELAGALRLLAAAQGRIVEFDRMATLGKLAAGVAHELNNPIAAIGRTANHLAEDLREALSGRPSDPDALEAMMRGMESPPISTRMEREIRRLFSDNLGDEETARRLVGMGIREWSEAEGFLVAHPPPERDSAIALGERFFRVGRSLRTLVHCGERTVDLVKGLKSYARWDSGEIVEGDVHRGIEDALSIFSHELRRIRVTKSFGDLPPVRCQMGRLNQVWTNLLSNAIQAMEGEGELLIATEAIGSDGVRVSLTDSGPGIPEDQLEKVIQESFTTKQGNENFGLGLGLTICREILEAQGGSLRFESRPGRTAAIVTLPIRPPERKKEEA